MQELSNSNRFDYFYGNTAENYQFFRIPKLLVADERYRGVSGNAKLLYGLFLDRTALSCKNGWLDDQGRVYIIYSISEIMETLCCAKATATKILSELDTERGIGLVEKVRRGLGEKNRLYVKDFTTDSVLPEGDKEDAFDDDLDNENESYENSSENRSSKIEPQKFNICTSRSSTEILEDENDKICVENSPETLENTQKFNFYTSRSSMVNEGDLPGSKIEPQRFKNYTSGSSKIELQEVQNLNRISNTNISDTDGVRSSQSSSARAREDDDGLNDIVEEDMVDGDIADEAIVVEQPEPVKANADATNTDTEASVKDAASAVFERVGLVNTNSDIKALVKDAIAAVLREDETSGNDYRTKLLNTADRSDIDAVCEKLSRYGQTVQNPQKYAITVLMNTLTERDARPASSGSGSYAPQNGGSYTPKSGASYGYGGSQKKRFCGERQRTPEEWDLLERKLLYESGYELALKGYESALKNYDLSLNPAATS